MMIDSNISMEEDTELRDLVFQTLENNGVLAKVRAELRASVFLTLEEQESVLNPEPFLNKTVKQYLANSEGKLLFSLVREFLEYFSLDYTVSVYDTETHFGKDYNYGGRKKLCEDLGINSKEPILGEILKNAVSGVLSDVKKNNSNSIKVTQFNKNKENSANVTFDISESKILSCTSPKTPKNTPVYNISTNTARSPVNVTLQSEFEETINKDLPVFDKKSFSSENYQKNEETCSKQKCQIQFHTVNNMKNMYMNEPFPRDKEKKLVASQNNESGLEQSQTLASTHNLLLDDLPPLKGKKADMKNLKKLIDTAQDFADYEKNLTSQASVNKQSFVTNKTSESTIRIQMSVKKSIKSLQTETDHEKLDEEIHNSSCPENEDNNSTTISN